MEHVRDVMLALLDELAEQAVRDFWADNAHIVSDGLFNAATAYIEERGKNATPKN